MSNGVEDLEYFGKYLKIRLTRKQYTELAKRFNLLSIQSLQFMSKKSYESIITSILKEK